MASERHDPFRQQEGPNCQWTERRGWHRRNTWDQPNTHLSTCHIEFKSLMTIIASQGCVAFFKMNFEFPADVS